MLTILKLFGRSPFAPLRKHMERVALCVHKLEELFAIMKENDYQGVVRTAELIKQLEHEADRAKNDIRNHLPKSLFLPIDRYQLLEILSLQDHIADRAEDVAVLCTLRELQMPATWQETFERFLQKNIEAFTGAEKIIAELQDLLESSFGGHEAEKVRSMVDHVAFLEHQADQIQFQLMRHIFSEEVTLPTNLFILWQKIFAKLGEIANLSESLANRVRMTLELK